MFKLSTLPGKAPFGKPESLWVRYDVMVKLIDHLQDLGQIQTLPEKPSDWPELALLMTEHPHLNRWEKLSPLLLLFNEVNLFDYDFIAPQAFPMLSDEGDDLHALMGFMYPFKGEYLGNRLSHASFKKTLSTSLILETMVKLLEMTHQSNLAFRWHRRDEEGHLFYEVWEALIQEGEAYMATHAFTMEFGRSIELCRRFFDEKKPFFESLVLHSQLPQIEENNGLDKGPIKRL